MTPELKLLLVTVMTWLSSALLTLTKIGMVLFLLMLLVNPISEGRDFLKIIALAVVLIAIQQRMR